MVYIASRGHLGGPRSPQLWHMYIIHCIAGASGGSKITTAVAQVWCTLHRGGIWGVQDHHAQLWHMYGVHCIAGASGGSKITTAVAQVWCTLHRGGIWGVQDHHSCGTGMVYIAGGIWGVQDHHAQLWHMYVIHCIAGASGGSKITTAVAQVWCTYCRN